MTDRNELTVDCDREICPPNWFQWGQSSGNEHASWLGGRGGEGERGRGGHIDFLKQILFLCKKTHTKKHKKTRRLQGALLVETCSRVALEKTRWKFKNACFIKRNLAHTKHTNLEFRSTKYSSWFSRVDAGKVVGSSPPHTENAILAFFAFFRRFFRGKHFTGWTFPSPTVGIHNIAALNEIYCGMVLVGAMGGMVLLGAMVLALGDYPLKVLP